MGSYSDVIRAIQWMVDNKDVYNIRVANLSFGATPQSYYWNDPLNVATMQAWQAGIVVVTSAGNTGPDPMTIGVPGNVPYVITVGAMSDNYTPDVLDDDFLTSFSSVGPTVEGFIKPEMIAPGGHVLGLMPSDSTIAKLYPQFHDVGDYFVMSGTSQSTAVVSGIAALILEANPSMSPDDVKCSLMINAQPAMKNANKFGYSIFQQGAGMVDAMLAVTQPHKGCANRGLDLTLDLAGKQHYRGPANRHEDGTYYN